MKKLTVTELRNLVSDQQDIISDLQKALNDKEGVEQLKAEIKTLQDKAVTLSNENADLDKKLKSQEGTKKYYSNQKDQLTHEVEQIHTLLDVLPNSIARKDESEQYGRQDRNLLTRICAYIAMNSGR